MMVLASNLVAGTAALAVALARPADPPPLSPDTEIPGGYLDSEDLRGSEPDDGHNKITLGSILFSLGALRMGAGVVQVVTALPDHCAQVYGKSTTSNTCSGLQIYGAVGTAFGGLMLAAGVGILAKGLFLRHKHRVWKEERGLSLGPWLGPNQQGVAFGFRF
jgi:hypothetical protein